MKTIPLLILPLLLLEGCVSRKPDGRIISITERVVGIDLAQSPATDIPHLKFGFSSTTYKIVPTSTNAIFAPPLADSFTLRHKPLSTDIDEDFATGINLFQVTNSLPAGLGRVGATQTNGDPMP